MLLKCNVSFFEEVMKKTGQSSAEWHLIHIKKTVCRHSALNFKLPQQDVKETPANIYTS